MNDEISMVSNICLLRKHKRLCQIFDCPESRSLAYLSMPVVGDLLQLLPLRLFQYLKHIIRHLVTF